MTVDGTRRPDRRHCPSLAGRTLVVIAIVVLLAPPRRAGSAADEPLVPVSGISPFSACTADAVATQTGAQSPNSAVEPWLTANPTNPLNLVGTWQQDRWSNGGARGIVTAASFDGGSTWEQGVLPGLTLCAGGDFQRASDPWLSFGPTGDLYHISLVFDADTPSGTISRNGLRVHKSTDGGHSWGPPITIVETAARVLNDKESISADPTDPNYVYAVWDQSPFNEEDMEPSGAAGRSLRESRTAWRRAASGQTDARSPVYFARSTDAGRSWEPARAIFDPGPNSDTIGNQIVVLPDGTLVDAFDAIRPAPRGRARAHVWFVRSRDRGLTWRPKRRPSIHLLSRRFVAPPSFIGVYDPESGQPLRTGDILPQITAGPGTRSLFLVWQDARFSASGDFSNSTALIDEIAFAMSTNGGLSWSKPIKVNQTPTTIALRNRQAFTPSVSVASDGTVAVTYYDFRFNDAGPGLKTDFFVVRCHPTAPATCADPESWHDEIRLTAASFDFRRAPLAGGLFLGDYHGLTAAGTGFATLFPQTTAALPAQVFFGRITW
jgi:hypothetical protein